MAVLGVPGEGKTRGNTLEPVGKFEDFLEDRGGGVKMATGDRKYGKRLRRLPRIPGIEIWDQSHAGRWLSGRVWPDFWATIAEAASRRFWTPKALIRRFYTKPSWPPWPGPALAKKTGHTQLDPQTAGELADAADVVARILFATIRTVRFKSAGRSKPGPPSRLTGWGHRRVPHFRLRLTGHCFWQPPAEQAQEAIEDGQGMRRAAGDK